jgi:SNF2 family DNA or RNA helicase
VRVLIASTPKMGAGTNVQDKLIALHHLDVPWRPSDIEQQEGRILRQGNENPEVKIFRYITERTFDSYSWVRHEVA